MDKSKTVTQQLRPLLLQENWKLFEDYLADEKSRLVIQLCNCTENDLKSLQGQLKVLDRFLGLKETFKTEMGSRR